MMTGRAVFLGLLLICVAADSEASGLPRKPSCPEMEIMVCPRHFEPVCGSDGNTYGNECTLCDQRQRTKMDILITKETSC
ncbi:probable pancreatic secretory proteinase inhibitor [Pagrus major]|uniref:probable pancreatic secretory proteinase inhibitor n=1 Tax=Pagrus major TaxID=143350 RepID=UPI003CC89BE7